MMGATTDQYDPEIYTDKPAHLVFLSPYYIQDNLLYVLAIILKNEINNLQNANDYNIFLSNSCAGYIINELKNKNEIKQFFRKILSKTILTLEFDYSSAKLNFSAPFNIIQKKKGR